jgi:hypothetical protein
MTSTHLFRMMSGEAFTRGFAREERNRDGSEFFVFTPFGPTRGAIGV